MKKTLLFLFILCLLRVSPVTASCNFTVSFTTFNTFTPCPPLSLHFTNTSSDLSLNWLWNFSDGSTDTAKNPVHVYFLPGNYTVTLVATDSIACADSSVRTNLVHVAGPTGHYTLAPDSGCVPLTVTFTGASQHAASCTFDFGNGGWGNYLDSTQFTYTYNSIGTFYPIYQLTDSSGCIVAFPFDTVICGPSCINAVSEVQTTEPAISIYPNPATSQLFIQTSGPEIQQVNIYNTTGSLVMAAVGSSMVNGQLSIVNLSTGVYIAEIKTKEGSARKRWVKM